MTVKQLLRSTTAEDIAEQMAFDLLGDEKYRKQLQEQSLPELDDDAFAKQVENIMTNIGKRMTA